MEPKSWKYALKLGFMIAVFQRIFLQVWMGSVYLLMRSRLPEYIRGKSLPEKLYLPELNSTFEEALFVIWRRWDAVHYLILAKNGYSPEYSAPTIFPPGVPWGIHLLDIILPGTVEFAAMVFATLCYGLFLALVYQFVVQYYESRKLAFVTVLVLAFLPKAYIWSAPMSEAPHMMAIVASLLLMLHKHWGKAALMGMVATLFRQQGVVLVVVAAAMWWEQHDDPRLSIATGLKMMKSLYLMALIPLVWIVFLIYRQWLGLPAYAETQADFYNVYFINPITGLGKVAWLFLTDPKRAFADIDMLAIIVTLFLAGLMLRYPRHRRLPLLIYVWVLLVLFFSVYMVGPQGVSVKVSFLRHTLTLLPLWVLVADRLLRGPRWIRLPYVAMTFALFLLLSAAHAMGSGGA